MIAAIVLPLTALADSNQLAGEASPYLRQHATDPVHWRAWTDKNLAAAKKLGRPILLSIGYSACHWCHVMQRESFTDPATAKQINAQFFPILIDREQRPGRSRLHGRGRYVGRWVRQWRQIPAMGRAVISVAALSQNRQRGGRLPCSRQH
ncbi:MAG: DUF255 domain-containing protein [Rhodospirillaceae bacterium]|nr:DUF255 domain-containing protein [Rhodospirillaceae bacterium]